MAMLSTRAPSMLPSIKCSNCGDDIEISKMGDHTCRPSTRAQAPRAAPAQQNDRQAKARVESSYFFNPAQLSSPPKQTKAPPPRIDPYAANRPYARTDVYASNASPTARGYPQARPFDERPSRQQRAPSDDLAPNYDNPFPVFPASPAVKTPTSAYSSPMFFSGLKAPGPAPQSPARTPVNLAPPPQQQYQQPQRSPRNLTPQQPEELDLNSPNFFSGLKAALPSGPTHTRPLSRDEVKRDEFFARKPSSASSRVASRRQDSVSKINTYDSYGAKEFMPGRKQSESRQEAGPSRPGKQGGQVDNFIASQREYQPAARSNSRGNGGPLPGLERPGLERSPSEPWQQSSREPSGMPERSATTNDLQSNGYSTFSNNSSSQTLRRAETNGSEEQMLPATTYGQTNYEGHYSSHSNSSSTSSAMSRESTFTAGVSTPPSDVSLVTSFAPSRDLKSNAYLSQYNPYNPYSLDDAPPMPQKAAAVSPTEASVVSIYPPRSQSTATRANPFSNRSERPTLQRSGTESSTISLKPRHSCRGCKEPIVGKSVKASDGRLTGRYHRACFVCTTCRAPFTTAQVYVLNDKPYCEQHYHELNGSLCAACDTGIEGQYRETDKREKLHPRCLTCRTCRQVLADEYFEVNNTVYCERHAMAEVRRLAQGPAYGGGAGGLAPPSVRAERRMTRLGVM